MGVDSSTEQDRNEGLISIITPSLNQGTFFPTSLGSVQKQTYDPVEHVVVDGGSTDETMDALAKSCVRWISESDSGMYEAINKGIAMSAGDILGYLNADDAYFPWTLDVVARAFDAHPSAEIVFGDGIRFDQRTGEQSIRLFSPFDLEGLTAFESLMQPAVFFRRRLVERIGGFDAGLRYVGDLDYWLRAARTGPVPVHVEEILAIERVHAAALSQSQGEAMAKEDRAMRGRHSPNGHLEPAHEARARRRAKLLRRRLWARFIASRWASRSRGWQFFWRDGRASVSYGRVLVGQLPRAADRFLPNAVRSMVAEQIIRGAQPD